jgi:hypothetical protein
VFPFTHSSDSSLRVSTVRDDERARIRHRQIKEGAGNQQREDANTMLQKYPLMNEYWQDKRANIGTIQVPAYVLASMSTALHTVGSLRGFEDIRHDKKWYAEAH